MNRFLFFSNLGKNYFLDKLHTKKIEDYDISYNGIMSFHVINILIAINSNLKIIIYLVKIYLRTTSFYYSYN